MPGGSILLTKVWSGGHGSASAARLLDHMIRRRCLRTAEPNAPRVQQVQQLML